MTLIHEPNELLKLVDIDKGLVDRKIFSDEAIYQLELENIFARAWNFMCHDSQIPNPGDFFMTFIGEDRVIVVRDNDGQAQVLINSCRHRGNAVCRAEEGHATSFMCTYHGWTYDLKGALVGVPGFKEVYHEELDRENWGLIKAAKVASYKGFVFANMDPEAPELNDYLGDVGMMSIDMLALKGDIEVIGGIQKYTLPCNWKLAADNVWDFYHPGISHASATMVRNNERLPPWAANHMIVLGEYGHALSGPEVTEESRARMKKQQGRDTDWRDMEENKKALGPVGIRAQSHPHIFPNMWIAFPGDGQVSLRIPKGPMVTEIWWWSFNDTKTPLNKRALETFGPAGLLEQDDGENWGESTRATKGVISAKYPLHYAMNIGHGEAVHTEGAPSHMEGKVNEFAQRWHYRNWAQWMAAESWQDLKDRHPDVPERM